MKLFEILIPFFIYPILLVRGLDDDGTLVQTDRGIIRGTMVKSENGTNYYAFREVPYAAPPIGENRFQNPKIPDAWTGILDTTKNTKVCYQPQQYIEFDDLEGSEDCLYLNVYTPAKPGSADRLPVLIWIHGGAFQWGSGTFQNYGPKYIMDHGVVVVSINYRLGIFGFAGTLDGVLPFNLGLKDQRFAMEWVQRNIHLFAGDPEHVVIVGESAGSISVGYHLTGSWEEGKQLYHGAIMQSGTGISGQGIQTTDTVASITWQLGKILDQSLASNDTNELLKVLQKADAKDILASSLPGLLAIEDDGPFSQYVFQAYLNGNFKKVPLLIGFNSEEYALSANNIDEALIEEWDKNPSSLIATGVNMSPENKQIAGKLLKELYTHNTSFSENTGAFIRFNTDVAFTTGICKQVELGSTEAPYYFYQFAFKGYIGEEMDLLPNLPPGCERVGHAEDLRYMWDDGKNDDLSKFPEEERLMLHRYVVLWTNFVKYFNPTPEPDPFLDNAIWLPSEPERLRYFNINGTFEMREAPRQYFEVKPIIEKYMEPPYNIFS